MLDRVSPARLEGYIEAFREGIDVIAQLQKRRAQLVGTAISQDGRISVAVNADRVIIEIKYADDIDDLTYEEISSVTVAVAQQAAAELDRSVNALFKDFRRGHERMPKLSEFIEGMPDVLDSVPTPPAASIAPPDSRERLNVEDDAAEPNNPTTRKRPGVAELDW
ncbi:YbaB/EbfC family nucleoid-associated protein [Nocardia sp. CDC160]|uniref:YbaB/EbfC family nucleoid-associated protein n=1 Tax=Nocardia sp. CDC160 TaxID=3112166 RepID=UPI002DBA7C54|nr:YbaB/EbfC family nucleoid-associated protein [Nocardia sp. CDC160]MEC3919241.1 YbaB/EbfC family nucleoid-associated protein [Nocardia sp. CDC160]